MNLLLLLPDDQLENDRFAVTGRRFQHIREHLKLEAGATLRAGLLDGPLGKALIESVAHDRLTLTFTPGQAPPVPTDIILLLALPRPKMLKRILVDTTTLGIKRIILLNSFKVEKSYWSTPELHASLLQEKLLLGLEQAGDTRLPTLQLEKRFKPFVEDTLPALCAGRKKLLAHPGDHPFFPAGINMPAVVAIGPEGGWTDYERDGFLQAGFRCHSLGQRILRVETAVPALLGRLLRG